jgi:hypothetical protein
MNTSDKKSLGGEKVIESLLTLRGFYITDVDIYHDLPTQQTK